MYVYEYSHTVTNHHNPFFHTPQYISASVPSSIGPHTCLYMYMQLLYISMHCHACQYILIYSHPRSVSSRVSHAFPCNFMNSHAILYMHMHFTGFCSFNASLCIPACFLCISMHSLAFLCISSQFCRLPFNPIHVHTSPYFFCIYSPMH